MLDKDTQRDKILQHWRVETYHYHLDNLMNEDNHIAYVNPFSISILRSFAVNLYQIFHNKHQDEKVLSNSAKTTLSIAMNSFLVYLSSKITTLRIVIKLLN